MTGLLSPIAALKTSPPAVPPSLVRRPRIEERLTRGTARPLMLVSAGPGAGKTLSVASWVASARLSRPVAWLTVGEADNNLGAFWTDLLDALRACGALPPGSQLWDIMPATGFGSAEVEGIRGLLAELPQQIVVVLDEFEAITDAAVLESFARLVDQPLPTLRLVLISRADPVLRLHRLRVAGQLDEIRTRDLAFTEAETEELFDLHGLAISPPQRDVLLSRTQGWPAGLRLAAMSLDGSDVDEGIARFSGSERSVADYLTEELTDRLAPDDRDFLLTTSICDQLTGDLADRLTGRVDGHLVLEKLVGANALVVDLDGRGEWFSYHPLLRELLRHRLSLEQPGASARLHLEAAGWQAARGDSIAAIRHAILAGDWDLAGQFMLTALPLVLSPEAPRLVAAIRPMAQRADVAPSLSTLLAAATWHFSRREFAAMERDATDATALLEGLPPAARDIAEVAIAAFQLTAARTRGDAQACFRESAHAIAVLDRTTRRTFPAWRQYRVTAMSNLGVGQLWLGDFEAAETSLTLVDQDAMELGLELVHINAVSHLAVLDAVHGRFQRAEAQAMRALGTVRRRGWASEPQVLGSYLALAMVEFGRSRLDLAAAHLDRALSASGGQTDRNMRLAIGAAAISIAVARHDAVAVRVADARLTADLAHTPDASDLLRRWCVIARALALTAMDAGDRARKIVREMRPGTGQPDSWERTCIAQMHLAEGDLAAAAEVLTPLATPDPVALEPAVEAYLMLALIADRSRRDTAALTAFGAALDLAEEEDVRRPFVTHGSRLAALMVTYQHLVGGHRDFVGSLQRQLDPTGIRPAAGSPGAAPIEALTERELIVLRYLPTMLKAGEIGADLYVSVNTVKAHLRSIYRKLDVTNRREAVERARSLALL